MPTGAAPHAFKHIHDDRADRYANFQPLHIGHGVYRLGIAGYLAETVVPHVFHCVQPHAVKPLAHQCTERAIHGFPYLIVIGESKANGIDRRHRGQRGNHPRRGVEHIDTAAPYLGQHVGIAS
nr:hypothetical protein [Candidatus Symbiopectobacterium sp. 'North America']